MPSSSLRLATVLAVLALSAAQLAAQDYPNRPIRLIVAANAGGPQDILARALGESLRPRLGQNLVVENRPGGNFIIGARACKNAAPDGCTLCMFSISAIGIFAPAGTPPERIALLNREMAALVKHAAFRDRYIEGLGFAAIGNTVAEFKASLPGYRDHAGELVRLSGIRRTEAPR